MGGFAFLVATLKRSFDWALCFLCFVGDYSGIWKSEKLTEP